MERTVKLKSIIWVLTIRCASELCFFDSIPFLLLPNSRRHSFYSFANIFLPLYGPYQRRKVHVKLGQEIISWEAKSRSEIKF